MNRIKELFNKYREQILYLFFGGATTLVCLFSVVVFEYCFNIIGVKGRVPSDFIAMTFAYITNKIWVFKSKCKSYKELIKEIMSFYGARLLTTVASAIIVYIFVDRMGFNNLLINLLTTIITVVLNYVFSKLFIFKK